MIHKIYNFFELKRKHVTHGKSLKIYGFVFLHGHGNITIGKDCTVVSSSHYNPTDGISQSHFSTKTNGRLVIGNNVGISNTAITASNLVIIEDNVLIGSGCVISDTDHHEIDAKDRIEKRGNVLSAPIYIRQGAFIGMRSVILKGVTIGENAIIGAGSIVTKNVPANQIWAGNPAKFVKQLKN